MRKVKHETKAICHDTKGICRGCQILEKGTMNDKQVKELIDQIYQNQCMKLFIAPKYTLQT